MFGGWLSALSGPIGIGTSILGLLDASKRGKEANSIAKSGLSMQKRAQMPVIQALEKLLGHATVYDPADETRSAVKYAEEESGRSIEKAMSRVNADYMSKGGVPGNSSEYRAIASGAIRPIAETLAGFVAQQKSTEAARKAQMLQTVVGAPVGQLGQGYFNASQGMRPDITGLMQLLTQSLGFGKQK